MPIGKISAVVTMALPVKNIANTKTSKIFYNGKVAILQ